MGTILVSSGYTDPWINVDGRNSVPTGFTPPVGTPQFPRLLNGYGSSGHRQRDLNGSYQVTDAGRHQAPWQVAGVDYYVGITSGTTLTSWVTACTGPNWTVTNPGGSPPNLCQLNNNIPVSGIDFSAGTGAQLRLDSSAGLSNGVTISNCKFGGSGDAIQTLSGFKNLTIVNCEFDGTITPETAATGAWIFPGGDGTAFGTVQCYYCYFHECSFGGPISPKGAGGAIDVRFNLMFNNWKGDPSVLHGNLLSYVCPAGSFNQAIILNFNTVVEGTMSQGGEFFQFYNNGGGGCTLGPVTCDYNTLISQNGSLQAVARPTSTPNAIVSWGYAIDNVASGITNSNSVIFVCDGPGTLASGALSGALLTSYNNAVAFGNVTDGTATMQCRKGACDAFFHGPSDTVNLTPLSAACEIKGNFCDATGNTAGSVYWTNGPTPNSFVGWTISNNIDMVNGGLVT